ncbi:MAG: pentapeptide repeat-containing protein [Thermodesulfobacteriota bacterium]
MANEEHLAKLKEGFKAWKKFREEYPELRPDLSRADLKKKDLSGFNLYRADLKGADIHKASLCDANLHGSDLRDANLGCADLNSVDLRGANLRSADLSRANLGDADLHKADLSDANLHGTDLSCVKGLSGIMLARANLSEAVLPDYFEGFGDALDNFADSAKHTRKLFLVILSLCVSFWLTIAATTDVALVTNSASISLPKFQTKIPIVGFYFVAPILMLCFYIYFHLHLLRLFEGLSRMPALFPDGRPLDQRSYPWLMSGLIYKYFSRLEDKRPPLINVQSFILKMLAWWLVPLTLVSFYFRFLSRHGWYVTALHILLILLAVYFGLLFYNIGMKRLKGIDRGRSWLSICLIIVPLIVLLLFSGMTISLYKTGSLGHDFLDDHLYPNADLEYLDISVKPDNWTEEDDPEFKLVKGAKLANRDLRHAKAWDAFLVKANLIRADLRGANFSRAELSYATINYADLRGVKLWSVDLYDANLVNVDLRSADLRGADLRYADLRKVDLRGTVLLSADLRKTDLSRAKLSNADLRNADLSGADLTGVKGLSKEQLCRSAIDEETKLPDYLKPFSEKDCEKFK